MNQASVSADKSNSVRTPVIPLRLEHLWVQAVQRTGQYLTEDGFLCNADRLRIRREIAIRLETELLGRDPRPLVTHLLGGPMRRAEIFGSGTKKDPWHAEWRDDYFLDT